MELKTFLPEIKGEKVNYISTEMSFYLIEEMHEVLVNFRENLNIPLEQMKENDGAFTEYSYWIREAIIKQEEFIEFKELDFDKLAVNTENELIAGKIPGIPKMTATDAKRNAPVILKEHKSEIIKAKSFLKRLKNIESTLFQAINTNARLIKISDKIY